MKDNQYFLKIRSLYDNSVIIIIIGERKQDVYSLSKCIQ